MVKEIQIKIKHIIRQNSTCDRRCFKSYMRIEVLCTGAFALWKLDTLSFVVCCWAVDPCELFSACWQQDSHRITSIILALLYIHFMVLLVGFCFLFFLFCSRKQQLVASLLWTEREVSVSGSRTATCGIDAFYCSRRQVNSLAYAFSTTLPKLQCMLPRPNEDSIQCSLSYSACSLDPMKTQYNAP